MIDRQIAGKLYRQVAIEVVNSHSAPEKYSSKVLLCGYADLQVFINGLPFLELRGASIKLMEGRLHFDPKAIPGKRIDTQSGKPKYYPVWQAMTPEARIVIGERLKACPAIQTLVQRALLATQSPPAGGTFR